LGKLAGSLSWAAILAASLLVAIAYGVVFESIYLQPIDVQGGLVFFLLGFLTVLVAYGLFRLISRVIRQG
jgi:hypothetical protein